MRRRAGSRPTPIETNVEHSSSSSSSSMPDREPIVPPLDPTTEKELRKSCSLLLLNPPSASSNYTTAAASSAAQPPRSSSYSPAPPRTAASVQTNLTLKTDFPAYPTPSTAVFGKADLRASTIEIRRVATPDCDHRTSTFLLAKPTLVDVLPSPTRPRTARSSLPPSPCGIGHAKTDSGSTRGAPSVHNRASSPWLLERAASPLCTAVERPKTGHAVEKVAERERPKTGHERRLSLFPRPRTATGGTEPERELLPPLPPLPAVDGGKAEEAATGVARKEKKRGLTQVAAFWRAKFRFGRHSKAKGSPQAADCVVATVP